MGTRSLTIILPSVIIPPAPTPHAARAIIKLVMLCARAHHSVASAKISIVQIYGVFRPTLSDKLPSSGWNAVDVNRNAVDSHDAEFELLKYDVMTGCDDAMSVLSKLEMKLSASTLLKISQKCDRDRPLRKGVVSAVVARSSSPARSSSMASLEGDSDEGRREKAGGLLLTVVLYLRSPRKSGVSLDSGPRSGPPV